MSICINGVASITFNKKEDEDRFNELKQWFKDDDATWQMFSRERLGEVITPNSTLFDVPTQLVEDIIPSTNSILDKDLDRVKKVVEKQISLLKKRINDLTQSRNRLKGVDRTDRDNTIEGLQDLLDNLEELETREQFIQIVEYSQDDISRKLDWLTKEEGGFNPKKPIHLDTFRAIVNQLHTYQGLNVPDYASKNSTLQAKILDINKKYRELSDAILENREKVIREMLKESTNDKFKDEKNFEQYLRESNDITGLEQLFLDIDTSRDTILGLIGKKFAASRQEVHDLVKEFTTRANEAGRNLKANGITNFDFMVDKTTARIVQKVSTSFKDTLDKLFAATDSLEVDERGFKIKKEYVKKPLAQMAEDEIAHNIQLASEKREISSFLRPEKWVKGEGLVDGENKKYLDSFKAARELYEVYSEGGWVKAEGVSQEAYNKYLKRYYGPKTLAYRMLYDADKNPTGEVEEYETRYVKDAYTQVTEKWDSEEYKTIQANPTMKAFYDFYVEAFQELMDKLPADIAKKMDGKVLRVKDDFMDRLLQKKTPLIKRILKEIKELFLPDIITSGRALDENGVAINDIGLFYLGDLKSEKRIAQLEERLKEITGTSKEDKKARDKINQSLLIENAKLTPETINYNLVESLIAGMQMATNYDVMKSVESSFILAQEYLHNKNFYEKLDKNGDPVTDNEGNPVFKKQGTSNAEKRLQTWMRMVFYNNSQANNTRTAKLALLLKKYTSFLGVGGLAVFPAVNNIVTAEMSNVIEGFGGRFYTNSDFKKSSWLMTKHLVKAKWVSQMFKKPGDFEDEKPYDLLTALVGEFNFLDDHIDKVSMNSQQEGLNTSKVFNMLYALTEGGEYQAQVRSGLAYLNNQFIAAPEGFKYTKEELEAFKEEDKEIAKDKTGKKKSTRGKVRLLDAFSFNEVTKEFKLRDGLEFSKADRRRVTGEIRNMNKTIHGNHSSIDRVPMQENWYGELAFQFKRWMPNAIRSRFAGSYYDESVGLEMEGRYRSIATMFSNMQGIGLSFTKDAWKKLSPLEQANMRKNAAEMAMFATCIALYIIFDAAREGFPPDDEYTRAALNFLKQQADRSMGEIDFFVNPLQWYAQTKSPVAGLRIIGEAGEFIGAIAGVPFYGIQGKTEKLRYQKGVNKGDLKVVKEGRDLIPGLKQISQFKQLDLTGDFFIR